MCPSLEVLRIVIAAACSCLLLAYLSWPFFMQSYDVGEMSGNAGGLIR